MQFAYGFKTLLMKQAVKNLFIRRSITALRTPSSIDQYISIISQLLILITHLLILFILITQLLFTLFIYIINIKNSNSNYLQQFPYNNLSNANYLIEHSWGPINSMDKVVGMPDDLFSWLASPLRRTTGRWNGESAIIP